MVKQRLFRRIAAVLVIGMSALAGLLLVAPLLLNSYLELQSARDEVGRKIKESLGREVHLDGAIRIQPWTLTPTFRVENVRLGNAPWATRNDMVRLEYMDIELELMPLLTKRGLAFKAIELRGAVIHLETSKGGEVNWQFKETSNSSRGDSTGLHLLMARLRIRNSSLSFRDGNTGSVRRVYIKNLNLEITEKNLRGRLDLRHGKSDLRGSFALHREPLVLNAELRSNLLELNDFLQKDKKGRGKIASKSRELNPLGEPLPFDLLRNRTARVELTVDRMLYRRFKFDDIRVGLALRDGVLMVAPARGRFAGGLIDARVALKGGDGSAHLRFAWRDLELGEILQDADGRAIANAKTSAVIDLKGSGANLGALAGDLSGKVILVSGPVRINEPVFLETVGPGAAGRIKTWFEPLPKPDCIVTRLDFQGGRGVSREFLIDAQKLAVAGAGHVDAGTRTVKLAFRLHTKKLGLLSLADDIPIWVEGPIAEPRVRVYKAQVASVLTKRVIELPLLPLTLVEKVAGLFRAPENFCRAARLKVGIASETKE